MRDAKAELNSLIGKVTELVEDCQCNVQTDKTGAKVFVKECDSKSEIGKTAIKKANKIGVDMIVVGYDKTRGLDKWLGSVSKYIIKNASCPVLVNKEL